VWLLQLEAARGGQSNSNPRLWQAPAAMPQGTSEQSKGWTDKEGETAAAGGQVRPCAHAPSAAHGSRLRNGVSAQCS